MLSPFLAIIGVLFAFGTTYLLNTFKILDISKHFYTPIFLLILYYTIATQWKRRKIETRPWKAIWIKSIAKYLFWGAAIGSVYLVYDNHGFYRSFAAHTRAMLENYLKLYAFVGLPYFLMAERFRSSSYDWMNDPYLKLLSLTKLAWRKNWPLLRLRMGTKRYKSIFLMWILRLHFLPVMAEQVYRGMNSSFHVFSAPHLSILTLPFAIGFMFTIDSINASIGYFWESAVTDTRFRRIDTNPFHWFVVLMCYMPFIVFASNFIPFPKAPSQLGLIFSNHFAIGIWQAATAATLLGIVICTSCLGFSYSNLSYKKIQTKGPYAIVRHPGTVFKITFFFLSVFQYKAAYTPAIIAAYVFWMGVYIMRVICEERFLMQFAEYRNYTYKTRFRLIPKVW